MMRQSPLGVVILNACYSGARDESLHSLAESGSQSSIMCVGTWVSVRDRAAVVCDVELMQAYAGSGALACATVDCDGGQACVDLGTAVRWRARS